MTLYDYANGDPVNNIDADGRLASAFGNGFKDAAVGLYETGKSLALAAADPLETDKQISQFFSSTIEGAKLDPQGVLDVGVNGFNEGHYNLKQQLSSPEGVAYFSGGVTFNAATWEFGSGFSGTKAMVKPYSMPSLAAETATFRGSGFSLSEAPGATGIQIPGRLSSDEMIALSRQHGDIEFAQVYKTGAGENGGGGSYWLYSGKPNSVSVPFGSDYRYISHVHPNGAPVPSAADMDFMKGLQSIGNPQRSSQILPYDWGSPVRFNANGTIE